MQTCSSGLWGSVVQEDVLLREWIQIWETIILEATLWTELHVFGGGEKLEKVLTQVVSQGALLQHHARRDCKTHSSVRVGKRRLDELSGGDGRYKRKNIKRVTHALLLAFNLDQAHSADRRSLILMSLAVGIGPPPPPSQT